MNAHLPTHAHSDNGLWMVGRIYGADQVPYEVSLRDMEADSLWAETMLGRLGIGAGDTVLLGYQSSQGAQWWPWLKALHRRHAAYAPALPSPAHDFRPALGHVYAPLQTARGIRHQCERTSCPRQCR